MSTHHPKISVVLRLESKASHATLAEALSLRIKINYSTFSEKSGVYRSQFHLWEGEIADLPNEADFLAKAVDNICRKVLEYGVATCLIEAEIAVFTHSDNQQVEIPRSFLETCVQEKVGVAVFFFHCDATEQDDAKPTRG